MKRIARLIETHSIDEVNTLISDNKFFLYERLVNNGNITFFVAETSDALACGSGQPTQAENEPSQCDGPVRRSPRSNRR